MKPWFYALARVVVGAVVRLLFRWEVTGREHVPRTGALVVYANHRSYWDPPFLGLALPRPVHFMAKEELFRIPVFAGLIRWLGAFPVRRGRADRASLRQALELLRAGRAVGVFPEGRRVRSEEEAEARAGVVLLAARAGAPVLPVAICGRPVPFGRVRVRIGPPFDVREALPAGRASGRELAAVANRVLWPRVVGLLHDEGQGKRSRPSAPDDRMIQ